LKNYSKIDFGSYEQREDKKFTDNIHDLLNNYYNSGNNIDDIYNEANNLFEERKNDKTKKSYFSLTNTIVNFKENSQDKDNFFTKENFKIKYLVF
jgi:hypothetical protein